MSHVLSVNEYLPLGKDGRRSGRSIMYCQKRLHVGRPSLSVGAGSVGAVMCTPYTAIASVHSLTTFGDVLNTHLNLTDLNLTVTAPLFLVDAMATNPNTWFPN